MRVFHYDSVDSTNDTAKQLLRQLGFAGPAYVLAHEQTAGKGTRGRKWSSPKDAGIYMSVVETPCVTNGSWTPSSSGAVEPTVFTLAAGVACVECLRRLFGICVELKPINDLYIEGRKLGGILTEAIIDGGRMTALITGIGINVLHAPRVIQDTAMNPISLEEVLTPAQMSALNVEALAEEVANDVHALNGSALRGEVDRIQWAWEGYKIPQPSC